MRYLFLLLVISLLLSSCSVPSSQTNNSSGQSQVPPDSSTSTFTTQPTSTSTTEPTATTQSTKTSTPEPTATTEPKPTNSQEAADPSTVSTQDCENKAEFIDFLSMSNNSRLEPGVYFTQVWRIRNTGSCTWTPDYQFVFEDGDQMNSPDVTPLSKEVPPGQTIDISLLMRTPMEANTYTSNWMIKDPSGNLFGSGDEVTQPFSLAIIVRELRPERKDPFPCG
jgi:hypothetical protein